MKHITILGSTGSIGRNTLAVIERFPRHFRVQGLTTNANVDRLLPQIKKFHPSFVCVADAAAAGRLKKTLPRHGVRLLVGDEGLRVAAQDKRTDQVVVAIAGASALTPLIESIRNNKDIALANKEALVMAGPLLMRMASRHKATIVPIDSEQSAIWQCLHGEKKEKVKTIYLTASGGPFRQMRLAHRKDVSVREVLQHPRWKMGAKITVDSATLMNKGLEVLEAMFLFGMEVATIKVVIHPEAIVHSMVEFVDGVIMAQLSITDMRIPIQYALSYPERLKCDLKGLDFFRIKEFHFEKPDMRRFPCLGLAFRAAQQLGTMPAVLNAANEVCVDAFLKKRLKFMDIARCINNVMNRHRPVPAPGLADIMEADRWARHEALQVVSLRN